MFPKSLTVHHKYLELLVLIIGTLIAFFLVISLQLNFLASTFLFFVVPSIYISFRIHHHVKKTAFFAFGVLLFGIFIDYMAHASGSWIVMDSILLSRFLGVFPYEDLLWFFFLVYYVVIFYEYFLDRSTTVDHTKNLEKRLFAGIVFFIILFGLLLLFTSSFTMPFFYLYFGLIFAVGFPGLVIYRYHSLLFKFLLADAYFAFVYLLMEIAALTLGHWSFPGPHFLAVLNFGSVSIPYEEIVFWILLSASGFLAVYEFFDDDRN